MSLRTILLSVAILGIGLGLGTHPGHAADGASPDAETAVPLAEPPELAPPDAATAARLTESISKGLRCPVCQGLSVADSNADSARAMHARVGELVAQGYSEQQILDYFVDRYGAWVRLEPEAEGFGLLVFVLPAGMLVLGGLWLASRGLGAASPPAAPAEPASSPVEDEYRRRILAELGDAPDA